MERTIKSHDEPDAVRRGLVVETVAPGRSITKWRGSLLPKIVRTFCLLTLACAALSVDAFGQSSKRAAYRVGPGDKLTISVFGQDALSGAYTVDAEGYVQLPLGDPFRVEGLTLTEFQARLKARLANGYVKDPEVSIRIAELRPVSIIGAVKRPGTFPFRFGMTVAEVLALAGGFGNAVQLATASLPQLLAAKERLALLEQNRRDLLIRLARNNAEMSRSEKLDAPSELESDRHPRVLSMIAQQQALLLRLNQQHQRSLALIEEQRPRIEAQILELKKERKAAVRQLVLASDYERIQDQLKGKGWARVTTLIGAKTEVLRYEGAIAAIDGRLSGLSRSLGDLELQLQSEENERMRQLSIEKQSLLTKLNDVEVSLPLAERVVSLLQGEVDASAFSGQEVTYRVDLIRKTNPKGERTQVEMLHDVSPGDIFDVRVTLPKPANNYMARKTADAEEYLSMTADTTNIKR